jgi:Uma2 family endonuclease
MSQLRLPRPAQVARLEYLRAPEPVHFPSEAEVPEGWTHLVVRTFLFDLLCFALGPDHSVGSDQFVYWLASNPKRTLSPDVFVRLNTAQTPFRSWKTWERGGPPDLAVEIVSPDEGDGVPWSEKLARYHEAGVRELLRFDPEAQAGARLRAWDRLEDDLVERRVTGDRTPCIVLGLDWVVCPVRASVLGLRLADGEGRLIETRDEAAEARGRAAAEARIRELEEELGRRRR